MTAPTLGELELLCDVCGDPIVGEPHEPHHPECPNIYEATGFGCDCDNVTCPHCCWQCAEATA